MRHSQDSPEPSPERLIELLRLKRHETPGESYFEELPELIRLRVQAKSRRSPRFAILSACSDWMADRFAAGRFVPFGIAACLALFSTSYFLNRSLPGQAKDPARNVVPVSLEPKPLAPPHLAKPDAPASPAQPQPARAAAQPAQGTTPSPPP